MEEILASIRRIISEEGESEPAGEQASFTVDQTRFEPELEAEPEPVVPAEDDVLELTDIVDEEDVPPADAFSFDDIMSEMNAQPDMQPDTQFNAEAEGDAFDEISLEDELAAIPIEPEPAPFRPEPVRTETEKTEFTRPDPVSSAASPIEFDSVDPADEAEAIISDLAAANVRASFGQFSDLLVAGYAGADKTLEGIVREMLKPMLKTWLDQNLPEIVERTVAREVARLARVKKP